MGISLRIDLILSFLLVYIPVFSILRFLGRKSHHRICFYIHHTHEPVSITQHLFLQSDKKPPTSSCLTTLKTPP